MTNSKQGGKIGQILVYCLLGWFWWHSFVICVMPMFGLESIAMPRLIGTWPEAPLVYVGGALVSLCLLVAIIARSIWLAVRATLAYGMGIAVIAILAIFGGGIQVSMLYFGFAILAISSSAALAAENNHE